ncbi:hypothetical protein FRACYDRAFT_236829 [Fragilariopsis cylindrus CCMP1102]|uniref:Pentacotripeptide-repeat region of PRORP domain-containing protein n=1 Tax=Fragilariopsis cylindrus CCMP1102 TaxID=635003 RepID=A0A1E7FK56_9STRA|nr:hypothetical protein FRACYDRAFT_236829 [Fragilariopsis cylindrus CCMP1102]|eukprot:OEU18552.1 hypothetical protein FRACYDRAFT_236829 [Fragilariopsis cylindrus CCMP1102]
MSQIVPVIAKATSRSLSQLNKQRASWHNFSSRQRRQCSSRCISAGTTNQKQLQRRSSSLRSSQKQYYPDSCFSFQPPSSAGRRRNFSELSPLSLSSLSSPTTDSILQTTTERPGTNSNNHSENYIPSSSSFDGPAPSSHYNHTHTTSQQENSIDKFSHFALNTHMVPLGSMQEEMWHDILDAIDAWLNIGGGFSIDSAERLLDRLINEHAASFSEKKSKQQKSNYVERSMILVDLQRHILNSWIGAFHLSKGNSKMALSRAEQAMFRLLDLQSVFVFDNNNNNKTTQATTFPLEEYFHVIEGYLNSHLLAHVQQGTEKAGQLLVKLISDNNGDGNNNILNVNLLVDHAEQVGLLFEKCATQLLSIDDRNDIMIAQLLEIMTDMKQSGLCPEINLPDVTERILHESTLQQQQRTPENNNANLVLDMDNIISPTTTTTSTMSSFEVEVAEKRLIDVLKSADEDEKDNIKGLIQNLTKIKPSNELVANLIEYNIRIGDVEGASQWLQQLEPSFLISSYNLVEDVLESWLEQKKGPKVPWRADEIFKAATSKILQHDDKDNINLILSTKSFNLIFDIWTSSEDPSASRKIIDWYSQMISWTIKPDRATMKMTLLALQKEKIPNSIQLVSVELLEQWNGFTRGEKIELANEVLKLVSFQLDSLDTVNIIIDQFQTDKILPAKSLFRSSMSAIRMKHTSPADVMTIVHSLDSNEDADIDLSLYTLAIDTLFKLDKEANPEIESVYDHVLKLMTVNRNIIDPNDVSEFLYAVIAMHVNRKLYSQAGSCLKKAENVLLSTTDSTGDKESPIPLKCYKKMIIRNWYTSKTSQRVEALFERLMSLYSAGYTNLQPDCDLYTAFINARASAGKEVEHNLEEMIELYKSNENEALLPQTKVFNTVLLSLAQDKKKESSALQDKSISLLTRMINLGVQPDIKTINLVLQNIIRGNNMNAYGIMLTLIERCEKNKLNPDSRTLHLIMDACGSAASNERDRALKKCLSTFGAIREKGLVGPITYGILSKVVYRLISKDVRADKVGQSILVMCCEDGMLNTEVRGRLRSMMSNRSWEKVYENQLSHDKREPDEWSRNTNNKRRHK